MTFRRLNLLFTAMVYKVSHVKCSTGESRLKAISIYCVLLAHRTYSPSTCTYFCNGSIHPFEKNCVQGLPRDFRQNNPSTNKNFRWSFSAISHQLSFDVAKKEKGKVRGCQIWRIGGMKCPFHSIETDGILDTFAVCGRALSECTHNLFGHVHPVYRLQSEITTKISFI
jgi:hypothetical protein